MITINHLINIIKESLEEMTAYHTSPNDFKKFNHKKYLGYGCGSQAFGWGTYVTDDKAISKGYGDSFMFKDNGFEDIAFKDGTPFDAKNISKKLGISEVEGQGIYDEIEHCYSGDFDEIIESYKDTLDFVETGKYKTGYSVKELKDLIKSFNKIKRMVVSNPTYIYEVDIPDNTGNNYLPWSDPISKDMTNRIASGFSRLPQKIQRGLKDRNLGGYIRAINNTYDDDIVEDEPLTGRYIYDMLVELFDSEKAASLYLLNCCGIIGVIYETGTLCGRPDGANDEGHNYVLFNANDIRIVKKELYDYD